MQHTNSHLVLVKTQGMNFSLFAHFHCLLSFAKCGFKILFFSKNDFLRVCWKRYLYVASTRRGKIVHIGISPHPASAGIIWELLLLLLYPFIPSKFIKSKSYTLSKFIHTQRQMRDIGFINISASSSLSLCVELDKQGKGLGSCRCVADQRRRRHHYTTLVRSLSRQVKFSRVLGFGQRGGKRQRRG